MRAVVLSVALIAVLAVHPVAAEGGSRLAKARSRFEAADAELNKAYKALSGELDKEKLAELRGLQREWLAYRDWRAESLPEVDGAGTGKSSVEYWDTMRLLTEARTAILRVYTGKNVPPGISGEYGDCYGGELRLEEKKDGIAFSISVVRGPTSSTGDISGMALKKDGQAHFKEKLEPGETGSPCEITFTFIDGHIVKVEAKNAEQYLGNNARFDGRYYKTGKLKEPAT